MKLIKIIQITLIGLFCCYSDGAKRKGKNELRPKSQSNRIKDYLIFTRKKSQPKQGPHYRRSSDFLQKLKDFNDQDNTQFMTDEVQPKEVAEEIDAILLNLEHKAEIFGAPKEVEDEIKKAKSDHLNVGRRKAETYNEMGKKSNKKVIKKGNRKRYREIRKPIVERMADDNAEFDIQIHHLINQLKLHEEDKGVNPELRLKLLELKQRLEDKYMLN